ncbi:M48 family metalloprotease [Diaphorobacter sp. HDW4B]|uniref:M48 family metalloprotease n=1 Tax=Diaphorobacter sp. HDW4B TaxID=2714925 RepID=UPI00140E7BB4|nr:M48 family metalloprotease [Diaphorobacter sp. HDW4B]
MKLTRKTIVLACGLLLVGCKTMDGGSLGGLVDGATMAVKATSLSDEEVIATSKQACEALDAQNRVADSKSKYMQRLNKVIAKMPTEINGIKAVYKVYLTNDVNAWAMDNGCIRVYSGLMDAMNDDELRGIIGHEIGHVALGHSKKSMQTAYATAAARTIAANSSNAAVASLSSSQLGTSQNLPTSLTHVI